MWGGRGPFQTGVWLVTTVRAGHVILLTFHLCEILKVCVLVLSAWCGPGLGWELHPLDRTVVQRPRLLRTAVTRAGTTGRCVRSQESDIFPQTPQPGGPGSRRHTPTGFLWGGLCTWRRGGGGPGSWAAGAAAERGWGGRAAQPAARSVVKAVWGDAGSGGSLAPSTRRSLRLLAGPSVGVHRPQLHSGDSRGPACWEVCGAGGGEGAQCAAGSDRAPNPSSPAGLAQPDAVS